MDIKPLLQQFINYWSGRNDCDFDGYYGNQCVDLVQFWSQKLNGGVFIGDYAYQIYGTNATTYDSIPETLFTIPKTGDVVVWDKKYNGYAGHIAIIVEANLYSFKAFSQNDPAGSTPQIRTYSYYAVKGYMRRKNTTVQPAQPNADQYVKIATDNAQSMLNAVDTGAQVGDLDYKKKMQKCLDLIAKAQNIINSIK